MISRQTYKQAIHAKNPFVSLRLGGLILGASMLLLILGTMGGLPTEAQVQPVPTTDPAAFNSNSANRNNSTGNTGSTTNPTNPNDSTNPNFSTLNTNDYIRASRLGITFISSAEDPADDARYANGLRLGAGWNRWPLYWNRVETSPNNFNWSAHDNLVARDVQKGLRINAILLNRPDFYAEGTIIRGLNTPIFADGSDVPAPGKALNPDNVWARFVLEAVNRYKPNGVLAQQNGWRNGEGIRVWEVWNEPDYAPFWQGGIINYARLLKVAYLAAKQADPQALVMFGGLLYATPDNWLARVISIFQNDPNASANNFYFDMVAIHSYSYPYRTGWLTLFTRDTLREFGLSKPIWVNESGVSVWDDYPGPTFASSSDQRQRLATADQAAWFFIQSTAYAWAEGADVVFFHQLYDDCGDRPDNFAPNSGRFGDAFGLFRNRTSSPCFSQHPYPDTPRPAARAFRMMAEVFAQPFEGGDVTRLDGVTIITFERPQNEERIRVVWNRRFEARTYELPAEGQGAQLYTLGGNSSIVPEGDIYRLNLAAAQPDNHPDLENGDISAIGGAPVIVVERVTGGLIAPPEENTVPTSIAPTSAPLQPTPGAILQPVARPTTAPVNDTTPPTTSMSALPDTSSSTFTIEWQGQDNGGIDRYMVWVQINGGDWQPWLETQRTSATYTGALGQTYSFAVWAVDTAGNWSVNTDLVPQATTHVE
jgi:hypothetical protein